MTTNNINFFGGFGPAVQQPATAPAAVITPQPAPLDYAPEYQKTHEQGVAPYAAQPFGYTSTDDTSGGEDPTIIPDPYASQASDTDHRAAVSLAREITECAYLPLVEDPRHPGSAAHMLPAPEVWQVVNWIGAARAVKDRDALICLGPVGLRRLADRIAAYALELFDDGLAWDEQTRLTNERKVA